MGPLCGLSVVAYHMWARPIRQDKKCLFFNFKLLNILGCLLWNLEVILSKLWRLYEKNYMVSNAVSSALSSRASVSPTNEGTSSRQICRWVLWWHMNPFSYGSDCGSSRYCACGEQLLLCVLSLGANPKILTKFWYVNVMSKCFVQRQTTVKNPQPRTSENWSSPVFSGMLKVIWGCISGLFDWSVLLKKVLGSVISCADRREKLK